MTALASLDTAAAVYAVDGLSALVPGTALRLPVLPMVAHLPADQRCNGCGGTGVEYYRGTLYSCGCMWTPEPPSAPLPAPIPHGVTRTVGAGMRVGADGYLYVTEVLV